jgi:hypothetical protein
VPYKSGVVRVVSTLLPLFAPWPRIASPRRNPMRVMLGKIIEPKKLLPTVGHASAPTAAPGMHGIFTAARLAFGERLHGFLSQSRQTPPVFQPDALSTHRAQKGRPHFRHGRSFEPQARQEVPSLEMVERRACD